MNKLLHIFYILLLIFFIRVTYVYPDTYSDILNKESRDKIDQYLNNRDFTGLEKMIIGFLNDKKEMSSYALGIAYDYIAEKPGIMAVLNEWCQKSPQSHIPFIVRGNFYTDYAWKARGGGYAYTVPKENMDLFKERLSLAKKDLELAYKMNPQDGNSAAFLITIATGLGLDKKYMETQFENAIKADPYNSHAYSKKLHYLTPQWHGSKEEIEEFINEIKSRFPVGSRLRLLAATHYYSLYSIKKLYMALRHDENVWARIQNEFEKHFSVLPHNMFAHNQYCNLAFYGGRYKTALKEFEIIGDDFKESIWEVGTTFNNAKTLSNFFCLIDKGDWKSAEEELALNPSIKNLGYIAEQFCLFEDYDGLEIFLNKLKSSGRGAQYHLLKGISFEKNNNLKEALNEYNNALKLNPVYSDAYIKAGHIYEKNGNIKRAIISYQKGIDSDPKNTAAYYDLGRLYEDVMGEHIKAICLMEVAKTLTPTCKLYYMLGKAYANINKRDKCIENWEIYLKMESSGKYADFVREYLKKNRFSSPRKDELYNR